MPKNSFVFLLALVIGAQPIATDLYLPAMPDLAQNLPQMVVWGVTLASTSSLTFFTLFYGLGQVMGGQWVDTHGRRSSLLFALGVYVICAAGCVMAPNMAWLLALRSIQGFATATIVVAARAVIRDSYSIADAPRAMSQVFIRMGVIVVSCPIIGGWLATHGGWRGSLTASVVYGVALLVWCAYALPETRPTAQADSPQALSIKGWRLIRMLWASPSFRLWTMVASATISGVFTFLTISSHLFIGYLGFTPFAYGTVLMVTAFTFVLSNFLCNYLLKKYDTTRIAKLGAGLSLLAGVIQVPLLLAHCLYQLGHGMLQSCAMVGVVANFPHMAGRAAAWSGLTMMVTAFVVSQTAASFVTPTHPYGTWPLALTVLFCGVTLVLLTKKMKGTMQG
jgi:MFS transporter, DHA1 family, multidrug resistance protein